MPNLYQLNQGLQDVLNAADENGEFDVVVFANLQMEKKEKQHNVIKFIQHLVNDQDVFKKEIDRLKKMKDMAERRVEWLKKYLAGAMDIDGVDKLDYTTHKASFRMTPPRLTIEDESQVPAKYLKEEMITKIDKAAIKADIKSGDTILGCKLKQDRKLYIS